MKRERTKTLKEAPAKKKKHTQKITRRAAKAKGRRLQTWVCEKISELTGYEWGRSGEDQPIESRPMGQSGVDVRMESQVRAVFPFSVECKSRETWTIPTWIKHAQENCTEDTDWLLFCKKSKESQIVILDAEAFFRILNKMKSGGSDDK